MYEILGPVAWHLALLIFRRERGYPLRNALAHRYLLTRRVGGTPVFAGTRVPVQTLIDYLEGNETIDDFLEGFPTVTREQVVAFLEEAKDRVVAAAS